jgi:tetratricopeptide (TPR) repeat protein
MRKNSSRAFGISCKAAKNPYNFWAEDWAKRRGGDYSETCVQLGNLYSAYKRFDDAKNAYIKAIELNSRNINARNKLADLYEKLGD